MMSFLKALWVVLERVADAVEPLEPPATSWSPPVGPMYDIDGMPTMDRNLALFPR